MKTHFPNRYRGYEIVPCRRFESWFVGIYPEQPELPVLARSILGTLGERKEMAVEEARRLIDRLLSDFDPLPRAGT